MKKVTFVLLLVLLVVSLVPVASSASYDAKLHVEEYSYRSGLGTKQWYFLVIENNSEETLKISASVMVFDNEGNLVGVNDKSEDPVPPGQKTVLVYLFDEPFSEAKYTLNPKPSKRIGITQNLSYESHSAKNKEILIVTNNGEIPARFVEVYCLFFNGDDMVDHTSRYFTDDNSEIKPGKNIAKEMDCYEDYDSFIVIFTGRG